MTQFGPRSVVRPGTGRTALGTLDTGVVAEVDDAGAVQLDGAAWTLDWWIGAQDRWHVPAVEAAVRQDRTGGGPVVVTSVRVPGGDIIARVAGATDGGRGAVVMEVENTTSSAIAVAFALRPVELDGTPGTLDLAFDGADVRVGEYRLHAERAPVERSITTTDPATDVTNGRVVRASLDDAAGADAHAVLVFPLPHTATIRVALTPDTEGVTRLPSATDVSDGWDAVLSGAGARRFADDAVTGLAEAAHARLLLDRSARPTDAASWWPLVALGHHRLVHDHLLHALARPEPIRDRALAVEVLESLALLAAAAELGPDRTELLLEAAVGYLGGVDRRRVDPELRRRARNAVARLAHTSGRIDEAAELLDDTDGPAPADLAGHLADRGESGRFGPTDDPELALAAWRDVRATLVTERGVGATAALDLLPGHRGAWRGGNTEVIDLPTVFGPLSYAIRWHGERPALLWDLRSSGPVTLRCSALDATWSTTEGRGETLLSGQREAPERPPAAGDSFS